MEIWINDLRKMAGFLKASNLTILKEIACVIIKYRQEDLFPMKGNPLIYAAMSGNAEIVARLLCKENSDQPDDEFGRTPLHFAECMVTWSYAN